MNYQHHPSPWEQDLNALADMRQQRDQLRHALTELAGRVEWLIHYHDTGATVTHWTDKQDLAEPGSLANCGALKDAYAKAKATLQQCAAANPPRSADDSQIAGLH